MMVFTGGVGALFAGLVYANIWWASLFMSAALGLVGLSVLGITAAKGTTRVQWIGCFICCAGYLAVLYGWQLDRRVGPLLVTTKAFAWIQPRIQQTESFEVQILKPGHRGTEHVLNSPWPFDEGIYDLPGHARMVPPQWDFFQQVGHGFTAIALGALGASVVTAMRRDQVQN